MQQAGPDDILRRYAEELRRQGKTETEIPATIATLRSIGDRAEIERWNRILTAPNPNFNTEPNAFLVAMTKGLKPGRSLDVGMGQARYEEPMARSDFGRLQTKVVRLAAVKP